MSLLLLFGGARIETGYVDNAGSADTLRITVVRRFTDDAGASDTAPVRTLRRRFVDPAAVSDTLGRAMTVRRTFLDAAEVTDAASKRVRRRYADNAGTTDSGLIDGRPLFPPQFDTWAGADLGSDTIMVRTAPLVATGPHGRRERDWAAAVSTTVTGCSVQPFGTAEVVADREFTRTRVRLFVPPGVPLTAGSRVVFDATTYEVDGEPGIWRDLDGRPSHIEATLNRLTG